MASIKDIAKKAGVSISTVSLALNYPERVSEARKQEIFAAIKELQYIPSSAYKNFQSIDNSKSSVALITGVAYGPFHYEIIRGINETLEISNKKMILLSGPEMHKRYLNDLSQNPLISGVILLGVENTVELDVMEAVSHRLAVVYCNATSHLPRAGSVSVDNYYIGSLVANHLLHIGYHEIALLGDGNDDREQRMKGFLDTLKSNRVTIPDKWMIEVYPDEKSGFTLMKKFIEDGTSLPRVIFCINDELALGALTALKLHNIQVPQQVAVIGCDGINIGEFSSPPLSTILMPKFEIGMLSANLLLRQINAKPVENIILNGKLIIRESCGYKEKRRLKPGSYLKDKTLGALPPIPPQTFGKV